MLASPPVLSQQDNRSGSSDGEEEIRVRGRSSGDGGFPVSTLPPTIGHSPRSTSQGAGGNEQYVLERYPSTGPKGARQSLKEPQPPQRAHTNLFGILASSATFNEMDLTRFGGHRDTLAMLALQRVRHSTDLPIEVFSHIVHYLDFPTYKSVRLTCRCWSAAFTYVRPLRLPPVYALPAEIVKDVYSYLSPLDIDAARHTCRKWMIASLEYRLLVRILQRAGFQAAVDADTARNEKLASFDRSVGGEWRLSKRLATECSLRPGWTGNGFNDTTTVLSELEKNSPGEPPMKRCHGRTSMEISCTIDSTQLSNAYQAENAQSSGHRFTISLCGKFLLCINDTTVYVYCIRDLSSSFPPYRHGGYMEFLVGVICPHPIVAVSMDTSKDRYTIAALMDNRTGLIMDVPELALLARKSGSSSPYSERDTQNVTEAWELKASPTATPTTIQRPKLPPMFSDTYIASPYPQTPPHDQPSIVPIHFIPHVMYRNLCSKTSPPLSVAICPHRRCVAFGCSAGIELHWQDARTGQELSRWMELVGPAEYIHFPPLRTEEEHQLARKLRLTSSRSGATYYLDQITIDRAWDYERCKFLRAVPLSDGKHLLYTDPTSGDLCIGIGLHHPFGRPKPIKKYVLEGPGYPFEVKAKWPSCYKASAELKWGARIVAGFGEQIWLFCVPPDFLREEPDVDCGLDMDLYPKKKDGTTIVEGVRIGEIHDLVELAVDASNGEVTVHAFSRSVPAQVYQIGRYLHRGINERIVTSDGRVIGFDKADNANLLMKGCMPDPDTTPTNKDDGFGLNDTAYRRLEGHDLPVEDDGWVGGSEEGDIEMKEHAVGDWVHDHANVGDDEGYVSDDEDAERAHEWAWNDAADGDDDAPDRSREGSWDVMALVRLEVEVLCGG
ncbi:MAG: hypothetical protein Q9170_001326 [Blastenia crenularia]